VRVQVCQDESDWFRLRLCVRPFVGGGEGLVEVVLDGGGGAAASRAEVDEYVGPEGAAELGGQEAGYDLGRRGALQEGNLSWWLV
jgi:hypothetical protein